MKIQPRTGSNPPAISIKEYKPKFITQFDPETGEFEWFARINPKHKITGGAWMDTFQDSLMWMAKQDLTGEQWKVFAAMGSKMDYNNYIRISQTDLADSLNMKQPQIARAIKKLIELDIIAEGPRAGLSKTYILNPNIGMKGKQKKQKIIDYAEKKHAREQEKMAEIHDPQDDE